MKGELRRGAKRAQRTLKGGVLALLLVSAWNGQAWSCYSDSCLSVENYVSTNGLDGPFFRNSVADLDPTTGHPLATALPGAENVPASTVNIRSAFYGDNKVLYKFVIKNCGKRTLYNVRLGDCIDARSLGADGFLAGGSGICVWNPLLVPSSRSVATALLPGESLTLTSADFPLDPISSENICDTFGRARTDGVVRNNVVVYAEADGNNDGIGEKTCAFEDLNLVQCKEYIPAPAILGDRVWRDLNKNGIQDCQDTNNNGIIGDAGDTGAECSTGIPGATVNLADCKTPSRVLASTTTDANGYYRFPNLEPGQYCVRFDATTIPSGTCTGGVPQFTIKDAGNDDAFDSDADSSGFAPAVTLHGGDTNRAVGAGVVCKGCPIAVDKKCQLQTPPPQSFLCSDVKPIDALTMIWTGQDGIYIKAWQGTPGTVLLAVKGPILKGEKVTVTGMKGTPNNQTWEIFSGQPDPLGANYIGQSQFHISCSDDDMDGPEDCGKLEGNNKLDDPSLINLWILDGMAGNGKTMACTPSSQRGEDACSFVAGPSPSCQSLRVRPKTLAFRYTGNDCSAGRNSQAADKSFCSGAIGSYPLIRVVNDPTKVTVNPTSGFRIGDVITVSAIGSDMGTELQLQVGGQSVGIHTSCSQPLAVGESFGSLELVQFNGQGAGKEVTYSYEVRNDGPVALALTSVSDDKLGELLAQTTTLPAGGSLTLEKKALISQTTTNRVTATARIPGDDIMCGQATDDVTVVVTKPTCDVEMALKSRSDDQVKFTLKNMSGITATLDGFRLNFPPEYGAIKEIKLGGSIFKSGPTVQALGSGVTISESDWTNHDVTKRQLDPGETRVLEVIFSKKGHRSDWDDIKNVGGVSFKEGCQATLGDEEPVEEEPD